MHSFIEFVSTYERVILRNALKEDKYDSELTDKLVDIFSRFGCRDLPTPQNIMHLIRSLAKHATPSVLSLHIKVFGRNSQLKACMTHT